MRRKYRIAFLFMLSVLMLISAGLVTSLQFSANIDEFLSADDPDFKYFKTTQSRFATGDSQMIIGIESNANVFNKSFLRKLLDFEQELMQLEGVKFANSIASLQNPVKGLFRIEEKPFIHVDDPTKYLSDTTLLFQYTDVYPKFVSPDRKSVCVFISLSDELPDNFNDEIQKLTKSAGFQSAYYYGLSIAESSYQQTLKKEVFLLSIVALFSVVVLLWVSFRSFPLVLISAIFLAVVNILTLGFAELIGASLNVLTVTIPAIVGIVSMSDIIHVYTRFSAEGSDETFQSGIINTYRALRKSLLLTSITTAIGFLSLIFTDIIAFRYFGIITAVGIFIAYLLTLFLLPIMLSVLGKRQKRNYIKLPESAFSLIAQNGSKILIATALVILFSVFYGSQVKINTYLYDDLDADDPLSQSLAFFEKNFFGIRDLELFIEVGDGENVFDSEVLIELKKLDNYLYADYKARDTYSLITLLKRYNRAFYAGKPSQFIVPENPVQLERLINYILDESSGSPALGLMSQGKNLTRIYVKTTDQGSIVAQEKNQQLQSFIEREIDTERLKIRVSGQPLFTDRSNERITRYLFKSLFGALIIIFIIIFIVYRSFRLSVIAFIPNILPMLMMLALMYWLDITLKKSTAVVFTIAFGIAVDDTIHFISRFQSSLLGGKSVTEALFETWRSTGKAILITSMVLIGGFGSFAFSSFQSTFLTGTLVSASLLTAVLSDLIVLPALIRKFYKEKP